MMRAFSSWHRVVAPNLAVRSLIGPYLALTRHRYLVWQLVKRDLHARYRGSLFGVVWSFGQPLLLLAVYGFVFGVVFQARWPDMAGGRGGGAGFAVVLFAGLILHFFLAECLSRAPGLIAGNTNYVKRMVFPLEILPLSVVGAAAIQLAIAFAVLVMAALVITGGVAWTVVLFPLVVAPLLVLAAGIVWLVSAIGVFLRDIGQVVGIATTAMLFVSPILFPLSQVPESLRTVIGLNPLTFVVAASRDVVLWGRMPDPGAYALYWAVALVVAWLGYFVFARLRGAFADVL